MSSFRQIRSIIAPFFLPAPACVVLQTLENQVSAVFACRIPHWCARHCYYHGITDEEFNDFFGHQV